MFAYGQTAANAIAVMSFLAADPARRAGSALIARDRGLSKALAAKLLTQLASAGFVTGQPGPGGGYTMAKNPAEVSLLDIATLFEQTTVPSVCPFGRGWCGKGLPCPLHESITGLVASHRRFLEETRLSVFLNVIKKFPQDPSFSNP